MKVDVIGAGPAGSYTAYCLAKKGHAVNVYEKDPVIGKPVQCTGILSDYFTTIMEPKKDFVESREDQRALNQARTRRLRFNFKMVDIPAGAELVFSRDENIKAKVVDDRNIEFNGEITNLSSAAQEALGVDYGVAGTDYWMYEGETLDERRRRFESGE